MPTLTVGSTIPLSRGPGLGDRPAQHCSPLLCFLVGTIDQVTLASWHASLCRVNLVEISPSSPLSLRSSLSGEAVSREPLLLQSQSVQVKDKFSLAVVAQAL